MAGRQDADRDADGAGDDHRQAAEIDGDHRLLPVAGERDEGGHQGDGDGKAQPAEAHAGNREDRHDAEPRRVDQEALQGHQHVDQQKRLDRVQVVVEVDVDEPDQLVPERAGVDHHGLRIERDRRGDGGNREAGQDQGREHRAGGVAGEEALVELHVQRLLLAGDEGLAEPVERDGEQGDGEAGLQPVADGEAAQRGEHVAAEAAGADHRGDDDHVERQHDHLVDADHQAGARRR